MQNTCTCILKRQRERQTDDRERERERERERVCVCQIDLLGEPQSAHKSFPVMANILIFDSSLNAGYNKR